MSGSDMRTVNVPLAQLQAHKLQYLSEGYELRGEKIQEDGTVQLTWRPTCCGGDERQR